MCTRTCGRSETSLNTVVHENGELYMNQYVKFFFEISLNFFKNCLSSYFYKLYKFIKIF